MKNKVVLSAAAITLTTLCILYLHFADVLARAVSHPSAHAQVAMPQKTVSLSGTAIWVGQGDSSRGLTDINKAHTVELSDNQVNIRISRGETVQSRDTEGITESRQVVTSTPNQWVEISTPGAFVKTYLNMDRVFNVAFINMRSGDVAAITLDTGEHLSNVTNQAAVTQLKRIVGVMR